MKSVVVTTFLSFWLLLGVTALPSRPYLELQEDGTHKLVIRPDTGLDAIEHYNVQQNDQRNALLGFQQSRQPSIEPDTEEEEADSSTWPHPRPPHPILDLSKYTIVQILNHSLHHPHPELPIHKLAWLVNRSSEAKEALSGDGEVTLLAPDDRALTPPRRREHLMGEEDEGESGNMELAEHPFLQDHIWAGSPFSDLSAGLENEPPTHHNHTKKEWISKIIGWVVRYHTLPTPRPLFSLLNSSTIPTLLGQNGPDSEAFRIHVDPSWNLLPLPPHPSVKFNLYARSSGITVKAKNGLIHLLSAPLLPPLDPLNKLFLFSSGFSTLTSDLQKVDLDDELEIGFGHKAKDMVKELKPKTVFAPTNSAFNKIGFKKLAILHSPFPISKKILKYILTYHVVPDIGFFTDYNWGNNTQVDKYKVEEKEIDYESFEWPDLLADIDTEDQDLGLPFPLPHRPSTPKPAHPPPSKLNITTFVLPTLLSTSGENSNGTLHVDVASYYHFKVLKRVLLVLPNKEGEGGDKRRPTRVWLKDLPARGGAVHVVTELLRPPIPHRHSDFWQNSAGGCQGKERKMRKTFDQIFGEE